MELYHTSPNQIENITENGRFGSFLFFSINEYVMTWGPTHYTYRLEIDENEIMRAEQLFYHENAAALDGLVQEFCNRYEVDEDTAEEIIAQRLSFHDADTNVEPEYKGFASWDSQHFAARAARILGYRGVSMDDEQGRAYMIDMLGREDEWILES